MKTTSARVCLIRNGVIPVRDAIGFGVDLRRKAPGHSVYCEFALS
jgi:hypothetical protein